MAQQQPLTVPIAFRMATDDGTDPLRCVADHCQEVAVAWAEIGEAMFRLADALDALAPDAVNGSDAGAPSVSTPESGNQSPQESDKR